MEQYNIPAEKRSALEELRQPFAIYQFLDNRVVTLLLSDGFCALFGYTDRSEAVWDMNHNMYKDTHPDDAARIASAAVQFALDGGLYEVFYRTWRAASQEYIVVHARGEHVYTEDGTRLAHVWYTDEGPAGDASEGAQALVNALREQNLLYTSRYDALTGLPNMTYFFQLAQAGSAAIREQGGQPMLLFLDLSGMKFFNEQFGFSVGNQLLQTIGGLLARTFSNENCCRIAADHFAVFTDQDGLEARLEGLFQSHGELYGGKAPPVHVGIYACLSEHIPVSTACDRAKLACSALKGTYASGFRYYSSELREGALMRQYIVESIDTAIQEGWIKVCLQPIIRAVSEKVCDAEALARWVDPVRGVLSPACFIPALEESGLIYKLDLYMVEQVLKLIHAEQEQGIFIVPHSINLSRSDFDACDMVEEIRRRVDDAGISRDRITIEITESIIGSDFDFMKEQVARFQALGFQVWMDDFGSGYSSLDVLQSIQFDLIKFDMSFMRKLDESEDSKVILTELMRMATALGVDTVCEGVETESQVRFLQEIGCSKLQGYYFSKPLFYQDVWALYQKNKLINREDPRESDYYESIGRVNLFDLGVITSGHDDELHHVFDSLPAAILELTADVGRHIRSNRSFQTFVKRYYRVDVFQEQIYFSDPESDWGPVFLSAAKQCCKGNNRVFFDDRLPDGSVAHSFARRISVNPVTGSVAIAFAVLSISEPDEATTYADIARALAADYRSIYVIDLETDRYIEYSSKVGGEELSMEHHGEDFFSVAKQDVLHRVYEPDRELFLARFHKENIIRELEQDGVFTATYRLIDTGTPLYMYLKITRMQGVNRIIVGVSNIDAQMKQKERYEELEKERQLMIRITALSEGYLTLFTVDPKTGSYVEYSSSADFDSLGVATEGDDFFGQSYQDAFQYCYPEDQARFQAQFTWENVLSRIRQHGSFTIDYRLMLRGVPQPVTLRAALFRDGGEEKLVVGVRVRKAD